MLLIVIFFTRFLAQASLPGLAGKRYLERMLIIANGTGRSPIQTGSDRHPIYFGSFLSERLIMALVQQANPIMLLSLS